MTDPSASSGRVPLWVRRAFGAQACLLVGMGVGRFSYAPMVPALIGTGTLSADQAGIVGAVNLAGYIVGGLGAPLLSRRVATHRLLKGCLLASVLCLALSAAPVGFMGLAALRGVLGVLVAVMMILGVAAAATGAPRGKVGLATGIAFTGVGLGIFFSALGLPWLLDLGLAWAWGGAAAVGAAGLLLGFWGWSGPETGETSAAPAGAHHDDPESSPEMGRGRRDGIRLVAAQALFSIGLVPHSIWWVDYLVRGLGWPLAEGGTQWILFGLGAVMGPVLWGRLADRIGFSRGLVLVFATLSAGIAIAIIAPSPATVLMSSLLVGAQPGLSAIIAGRAREAMGTSAMVVLWRWMVVAVGAGQLFGGWGLVWLVSVTGDYVPVFLIGAAAMAGGAVLSVGLGRRPV